MVRSRALKPSLRTLSRKETTALAALSVKKFRRETGRTIAEGEDLVGEVLASPWQVHQVIVTAAYLQRGGITRWADELARRGAILRLVDDDAMKRISTLTTAPGLLAVVSPPVENIGDDSFILALDRIADPVNLGAIARVACFYGVSRLWLSEDCADPLHPRALRAAMGGLFHLPFRHTAPLCDHLQTARLDGVTIIVADAAAGVQPAPLPRNRPVMLVLGSEAHGVRPEIAALAHTRWRITPRGRDLTLNVAAAAAVLLDRMFQQMSPGV